MHPAALDSLCVRVCEPMCAQTGTGGGAAISLCVCQSQRAVIQYSDAPTVLLHKGNASSITTSPRFANCSTFTRAERRANYQAERDFLHNCQVNSAPPLPSMVFRDSFTLPQLLIFNAIGAAAGGDGQEGKLRVTGGWQNAVPSKQGRV